MIKRLCSTLALALMAAAVQAQPWPNKPVTLVVPFPPGGSTDTVARALGPKLQEKFGQTFLVDNKAGATGTIGAGQVRRAAPDGYTFLVTSLGPLVVAPHQTDHPLALGRRQRRGTLAVPCEAIRADLQAELAVVDVGMVPRRQLGRHRQAELEAHVPQQPGLDAYREGQRSQQARHISGGSRGPAVDGALRPGPAPVLPQGDAGPGRQAGTPGRRAATSEQRHLTAAGLMAADAPRPACGTAIVRDTAQITGQQPVPGTGEISRAHFRPVRPGTRLAQQPFTTG